MEANGRPGYVNISEKTKKVIEGNYYDKFSFEENKEVFISNIGENINSFLIHKTH